ncbi:MULTISPECIES: hypothetical protein [unclassified Ruegeria]|uniref:hypothetical protein n=1 Tax=unclassified Ruegeria TaxID=2625375 RepID=UPI00148940B7|nr:MULTISPECIES: hypothetical protein [unclassified Ruegeria]
MDLQSIGIVALSQKHQTSYDFGDEDAYYTKMARLEFISRLQEKARLMIKWVFKRHRSISIAQHPQRAKFTTRS